MLAVEVQLSLVPLLLLLLEVEQAKDGEKELQAVVVLQTVAVVLQAAVVVPQAAVVVLQAAVVTV